MGHRFVVEVDDAWVQYHYPGRPDQAADHIRGMLLEISRHYDGPKKNARVSYIGMESEGDKFKGRSYSYKDVVQRTCISTNELNGSDEPMDHARPVEINARPEDANLLSSEILFKGSDEPLRATVTGEPMHTPVLDIDVPVRLQRSKTPGHYHLFFPGLHLTWPRYAAFLAALRDVGLIEEAYYKFAMQRQATFTRMWPTATGFKDNRTPELWPYRMVRQELTTEEQMLLTLAEQKELQELAEAAAVAEGAQPFPEDWWER